MGYNWFLNWPEGRVLTNIIQQGGAWIPVSKLILLSVSIHDYRTMRREVILHLNRC